MKSLVPKSYRWWLFVGCAVFCGLLLRTLPSIAQTKKMTDTLTAEREKYEGECATAIQPAQKRYANRLKALQAVLLKKGDKDGVTEIETELERLGDSVKQQMNYPIEGKWRVEYTSGAKRVYVIEANGGVTFADSAIRGHFTKVGNDVLVDFGDNKLERFHWKTVLAVEHFDPKSTYGVSDAKLHGFAYKVE